MDRSKNHILVIFACIGACFQLMANHSMAQQEVDDGFEHKVTDSMFAPGEGGLVAIDAGHNNFHTKDGRYKPFATVLESDGYNIDAHIGKFTTESLSDIDILVISNALHSDNETNWELPVLSAFSDLEIEAVVDFVDAGGGLFLIADHMPMPGAAAELAARFSIEFSNGFAFEIGEDNQPNRTPSIFKKTDDRIGDHPITRGRHGAENIHQVATFTGSAFPVSGDATSLIQFGENATMLLPTVAWEFDANTASIEIPGWSQGVALKHGDGRVVIFGEAAMFTSQVNAQSAPFGLSHPQAKDNQQLLLNIIHWLSHDL
jgi:hypothetical protein